MDGFEVFDPVAARSKTQPHRIGAGLDSRTIRLSGDAYAALGEPAAVELLYHRVDGVIAIRPAAVETVRAMVVWGKERPGRAPMHNISALRFYRYYDIAIEKGVWLDGEVTPDDAGAPLLLLRLPQDILHPPRAPRAHAAPAGQTRRTVEALFREGLRQAEIVRRTGLTTSTVSYHLKRIRRTDGTSTEHDI